MFGKKKDTPVYDQKRVFAYLKEFVRKRPWITDVYLDGSRKRDFGWEGTDPHMKPSKKDSDWDIIFVTKFPVVNVSRIIDKTFKIDARTMTEQQLESHKDKYVKLKI